MYLIAVMLCMIFSLATHRECNHKMAAVIFSQWTLSNSMPYFLGTSLSFQLFPIIDLMWGVYACYLYPKCRSRLMIIFIFTFALMLATHVAYQFSSIGGSVSIYAYYSVLNAIFAGQILAIIVDGCLHGKVRWIFDIAGKFFRLNDRHTQKGR